MPGAQQLELLRRLNLAGSDDPALADRVLHTSAAGRGHGDLPLGDTAPGAFGARGVDPEALPPYELVRVASVLLGQDLVARGAEQPEPGPVRPWRLRYRLVGDPLVVDATTRHLTARGRPPGGRLPFVVVAAGPLDTLLAHTWSQRSLEHGSGRWGAWLRFWSQRDQLPPRLDLPGAVRRWSPRRPFVRIVTDPSRLARSLGVLRLPQVPVPGADQVELARRVAPVVGLLAPASERPGLMRTFAAALPETATPPVSLPEWARPWADTAAQRLIRELRRADYPVVGDLADLAPRPDSAPTAPTGAALERLVLDLAIRMLVESHTRGGQR